MNSNSQDRYKPHTLAKHRKVALGSNTTPWGHTFLLTDLFIHLISQACSQSPHEIILGFGIKNRIWEHHYLLSSDSTQKWVPSLEQKCSTMNQGRLMRGITRPSLAGTIIAAADGASCKVQSTLPTAQEGQLLSSPSLREALCNILMCVMT